MVEFKKWHDIESLQHVIRSRGKSEWMRQQGPITYRPKIKLHGTNAAIRITNEGIFPQSRSQVIGVGNDNCGFAAWLETVKDQFSVLHSDVCREGINATFYGEWCGPGIQKGTAINRIDHKIFAIFAVELEKANKSEEPRFFTLPDDLIFLLGSLVNNPSIYVLPWMSHGFTVNFDDGKSIAECVEAVNCMVAEAEKVDPWVQEVFDIVGPGEGFVFYARRENPNPYFKQFMFKAKGEAHRVNKTKTATQVDPEVLRSVQAFVDYSVTIPRLEQGLTEVVPDGDIIPEYTGSFLKWVMNDIIKECTVEMVDNNLTWKQVSGACAKKARDWFLTKSKEL